MKSYTRYRCDRDEFESVEPTATSDRACKSLTVCAVRSYDLIRAPYALYGIKYIDLVALLTHDVRPSLVAPYAALTP